MSNLSMIAIKNGNEIKSICCCRKGFLEYTGNILFEYYNIKELILKLMDLGDLLILGASTEKPKGHSLDNPIEGYCVAYGRDSITLKELGNKCKKFNSLSDLKEYYNNSWCEYLYLFDCKDNKWKYICEHKSKNLDNMKYLTKRNTKSSLNCFK